MKLRIKFTKTGAVRYLGHLDIMRFFQKAIRRAGIDITYTEGFSPHQIMAFANPLGVGVESVGEYFDIEVNSLTSSAKMLEDLNRVTVPGIQVLSVKFLPEREPNTKKRNAMALVAAARYRVQILPGKEPHFSWEDAIANFYNRETIPVVKISKKSETQLDLKESVYEMKAVADTPYTLELFVNASSSGTGNIKPTLVMEELYRFMGEPYLPFSIRVTRLETYMEIEEEGLKKLVPLEYEGKDF